MSIWNKTARKLVMFALVVSSAQFPVRADLTKAGGANKGNVVATKSSVRLTGRLTADGPVAINGNKARTGDTIFPGAVIETPPNVGATVQLGALGQLDLSPNTSLSLSFDQGNVQGELLKGCAILNTNRGVNGLLRLPRGEMRRAETGKTLSACADGNGNELTGAKSARLGRNNGINLGGGSVSWFELSGLLAGSGVLTGGLRLRGTQDAGGGCCCCCCCNPSPSAPQQ